MLRLLVSVAIVIISVLIHHGGWISNHIKRLSSIVFCLFHHPDRPDCVKIILRPLFNFQDPVNDMLRVLDFL